MFNFKNFIENNDESTKFNINENEIINWMQKWYFDQCDEDWEHSERFIIKNDRNGWHFSMFLEETIYKDKFFETIKIKKQKGLV